MPDDPGDSRRIRVELAKVVLCLSECRVEQLRRCFGAVVIRSPESVGVVGAAPTLDLERLGEKEPSGPGLLVVILL